MLTIDEIQSLIGEIDLVNLNNALQHLGQQW